MKQTLFSFLLLFTLYGNAQKIKIDGIKYAVTEGINAKVVSGSCSTGDLTLPATVTIRGNIYSVTSIGSEAFKDCLSLTSVSIPNSVTSIGRKAFFNCRNLTSVAIPNSVTSIGDYAFFNCYYPLGLPSDIALNSVTLMGKNVFGNDVVWLDATGIVSEIVQVEQVEQDGIKYAVTEGTNVKVVSGSCYAGNLTLPATVTIRGTTYSVTSIGDFAFLSCSGLTSVSIPDSVISIGDSAFSSCKDLTSISVGNSATSIGDHAFSSCSVLTSVSIGKSVLTREEVLQLSAEYEDTTSVGKPTKTKN